MTPTKDPRAPLQTTKSRFFILSDSASTRTRYAKYAPMYVMRATIMRIRGDSKHSEVKSSFVKSKVERIPLNMNVVTKIFTASSGFSLKRRKKMNKLVAEITASAAMFRATKNLSIPSKSDGELAPVNVENKVE